MKISTSIIIFFLSMVALVAEIFLYMFVAVGAGMSGAGGSTILILASVLIVVMVVTGAAGVLAPVCALIEYGTKKKNLAYKIYLPALLVIGVGFAVLSVIGVINIESMKPGTGEKASVGSVRIEEGSATPAPTEEEQYRSQVTIKDLKVAPTVFRGKGVFGEVHNGGQRTLNEVRIKIYFLDGAGQPIHEEDFIPVWVSEYSFNPDTNKPLKPGYSRKFGVKADNAPSDWKGQIRAEVTEVAFQK